MGRAASSARIGPGISSARSWRRPRARYATLSPRQRRTLDALLDGLSEPAIAARLRLSRHTVHQYVREVYRSFGARSRGELIALCRGSIEGRASPPSERG